MIRFKNKVLPVWIQWDGDERYFERAKQSIIDDIKLNGFDHYTGYADITDEPSDEEKEWDGSPAQEEIPVKETKKTTTKKANKGGSLTKGSIEGFAEKPSTDFDTSKTAS